MKGSIAAINREARERGMSYGKYLAFRAAQKAPASGTKAETTAKPKRSMPPGAGLGLAEARRRMGLSREEVALKLGVHMLSIKNWETGKNRPRAQYLPDLARVYGLSMAALQTLLGLEPEKRSLRQSQAQKQGHALRQARLRAGLSLEQAAWRMNVTTSAIRQWETGKNRPKPQSQRKIAQAYGLEPKALERMLEEARR